MKHLESCLAEAWPAQRWQDVTVLLAVSGGPDSVALARAMTALRPESAGRLVVAHFNHALRGAASDVDEQFVVGLCNTLGLECCRGRATGAHSDDADVVAPPANTSEEATRAARYDFLIATAGRFGARYVVTAHTADDQAETVLHRIVRGTGLAGLAGMAHARELFLGTSLVRPLLAVRRADVLAYLDDLGQPFREDSSNADRGYTRNRLRHELLPQLAADYNPRIVEALLRLAALAGEGQAAIETQALALAGTCVLASAPGRILINALPLKTAPRCLVREALIIAWRSQGWPLQAMGYDQWEQLAALAAGPANPLHPPKHILPGEIVAERAGDRMILSRKADSNAAQTLNEER